MKSWDKDGNIIDVPDDTPVNDLMNAPIFSEIPIGAVDAILTVRTPDDRLQIGRIPLAVLQRGTSTPSKDAVAGAAGTSMLAAPMDHTHPTRAIGTVLTLNASGEATWTFSRSFASKPAFGYMVEQTTGAPIVVEIKGWVMNGTDYVGCNVKAYRSQNLPALSGIILISPLISALANFNTFGGGSLNGVTIHLTAREAL